ncbi:Inherit from NOG: PLDc [Seminavis robusta]|uniref:Inherit from NOG: PLDc n=1 Tax=Seminavis robusta TaxID=568900 RepID=A0A9N8EQG5_9STRA|nr:Inherit from NOG: PLDc [Seminavis robusta]|eukprot:Sro1603_g285310.1 Inherit from NOG: PLDc (622) ;mRNA; f:11860-13825
MSSMGNVDKSARTLAIKVKVAAVANTENTLDTVFEFLPCCATHVGTIPEDVDAEDATAAKLSYVGQAAYQVLRTRHPRQHHQLWNVTTGRVVGSLQYTPYRSWKSTRDLTAGHDDWFPEKLAEIITRTHKWCDIMSLGPPDGMFMTKFKEALHVLALRSHATNQRIVVRMMFGNIVGMPVNCTAVIRELTKDLPSCTQPHKLHLWVGAWRKGTSWNHAKIIAVDGKYLHTGGHNLWDFHYLKHNPVHDLSLEMEGRVANDGHLFANAQWAYIERKQLTCIGSCVDRMPDAMPMFLQSRVTVSEYPEGVADIFPPMYNRALVLGQQPQQPHVDPEGTIPVISMGRYGAVMRRHKPSDDAIVAMLESAHKIVRLALQDLGPVCIPGTKITIPGLVWPRDILRALGRIIWTKGVDVEILLSNPNSIPGGLTPTEANYGNGWNCVDVASEIIKTIVQQFPQDACTRDALRKKVQHNLRLCFIRLGDLGSTWEDGTTIGMHAKHFIIDDRAAYIGSQNLYICDLAEWGVVIDDETQVQKMMQEYWNPMWDVSFLDADVDVEMVLDGLGIDRSAPNRYQLSAEERKMADTNKRRRYSVNTPIHSDFYDTFSADLSDTTEEEKSDKLW